VIGRAAPFLIVVVAAAMRLYGLTAVGMNSDEAVYSGQAASIAGDAVLTPFFPIFRAHPLLVQTTLALAFNVDDSDTVARLTATIIGVATIVLVYLLGSLLYGRRVGLAAALFMAVMPYHVIVTRQFLLDGPLTFLTTLTLYCLARFGKGNSYAWLYAAGAVLGLAFLSKETAIVFIAATYAFLALVPELFVRLRHLAIAMLTMGLVIACFPLSLALAGGGGASTAQQYFVWQLLRRPNHDLLFYPTVVPQAVGLLLLLVALVSLWVFRSSADWRLRLLLAWVLVPVTFFELWPTKGFQYLLPAAPVVAILAARLLVDWRPRRVPEAPRWVPKLVRQPRSIAVLIVAASLAVQSAFTILGPAAGQVLAGGGGVSGGREAGQWIDTNLPASAQLVTIGPSMGNILEFYGHRTTRALSVSPDPLKRNPSYEPIRNADLSVRTGEFRYLVWDAFSAARTSHFSDKLMELVRRYDGRLVHVQTLSGAASGTTIGTPIIQIYEVQPAASATLPAPQSAATPDRPPVRREFIYASYTLAVVIAAATILKAAVGSIRVGRR
jgi:MFS family permease